MDREQLLEEAESFFCKAMATDSYASGAKPHAMPAALACKGYEYRAGDFRLLDVYFVHPIQVIYHTSKCFSIWGQILMR